MQGAFREDNSPTLPARMESFKRDTLYFDMALFKRAAKLTGYRG